MLGQQKCTLKKFTRNLIQNQRVRKKVETKQRTKKIGFIELLLHLFLGLEIDNNE